MTEVVTILKALADRQRFEIVQLLRSHDLCVGALAARLGISESAVSQHLKVLREAGLVIGEKRGYFTHYNVQVELLRQLVEDITGLITENPGSVTPQDTPPAECSLCRKEGTRHE